MKNNKGFTLIELIVTLAILGILFFVAVPRLNNDSVYIEKMAREFAMDVRYIQMQSMKLSLPEYKIYIYPSANDYKVRKNLVVEKTVTFKDKYNIHFSNLSNTIGFTNEGIPTSSGTFTITNTKTSEKKQVTIVLGTGRTKILE